VFSRAYRIARTGWPACACARDRACDRACERRAQGDYNLPKIIIMFDFYVNSDILLGNLGVFQDIKE